MSAPHSQIPLSFNNPAQAAYNRSLKTKLPGVYSGVAPTGLQADYLMGFDQFARTALDLFRDGGVVTLPTNNAREIRAFFCEANYRYLLERIQKDTGYPVHEESLWEGMLWAFTMTRPRSDPTDPRHKKYDPATTDSYVCEMNKMVIERISYETIIAQRHLVAFRNRGNTRRMIPDDPIDTRTRNVASMYSFDYMTHIDP